MKKYSFLVIIFCSVFTIQSQVDGDLKKYTIKSSSLGSSGSSNTFSTSKGKYFVSQSIGQSSVIGTSSKGGYYLRQGYQQPPFKIKIVNQFNNNSLQAKVYPNPFKESISISFTDLVKSDILVSVFDVSGKLIYSEIFSEAQRIELNLSDIPQGTYILKLASNTKSFNSKLIKI